MAIKVIKIMNAPLRLLYMLALSVSVAGCVKDDLSDCPGKFTFTVRAYDNSGTELGQDDVRNVQLYVFDDGMRFVKSTAAQVGQKVTVKIPAGNSIHVVAWGNLNSGLQHIAQPDAGAHKNVCLVNLLSSGGSFYTSPDDLFREEITVPPAEMKGNKEISIYRVVGSMAIIVRNLREFSGIDDNYSIVVRETLSAINFYGNPTGNAAAYKPSGSFVTGDSGQEYFTPAFNMIPGLNIAIEIYCGTQLVASVSQNNAGNPIKVEKGKLTNVLIELHASVGVSMALTPWGQYQVWKKF